MEIRLNGVRRDMAVMETGAMRLQRTPGELFTSPNWELSVICGNRVSIHTVALSTIEVARLVETYVKQAGFKLVPEKI